MAEKLSVYFKLPSEPKSSPLIPATNKPLCGGPPPSPLSQSSPIVSLTTEKLIEEPTKVSESTSLLIEEKKPHPFLMYIFTGLTFLGSFALMNRRHYKKLNQ